MISLIQIIPDLKNRNLQQPGANAFGSPICQFWINFLLKLLNLKNIQINSLFGQIIGIGLIFLITLIIAVKSRIRQRFKNVKLDSNRSGIIFLFMSSAYISCFIAGMNYNYRLIFLICAILHYIQLDKSYSNYFFLASITALTFTCFPYFGFNGKLVELAQWAGNFAQFVVIGYFFNALYCLIKNSSSKAIE